jgi:antitoxin CptB
VDTDLDQPLGQRALSKLKWRCRRGLLENDLLIERFFEKHEAQLTVRQADAMSALMELADNDLMDLLLRRKDPEGELDTTDVKELLGLLRPATEDLRRKQT